MATSISKNDLTAGAVFTLFGAFFVTQALSYDVGTAFKMGPGFMPSLLGGVLAVLGISIAISGLRKSAPDEATTPPSWRAIILILGVVIFFGATLRGLGFVPVVLICTFVTALASRLNSPTFSAILALGLAVLCTLIFVIGLGLPVPLFGPWLGQ